MKEAKNHRKAGRRLRKKKDRSVWLLVPSMLGLCSPWPLHAAPVGGTVVHGKATIAQSGNTSLIHASNKAILDFSSFDIASNETVHFFQPSASSSVLVDILNPGPTRIFGRLLANGSVVLENPAGIYFGNGSYVNVGALYATAGNISNSDFLAGRMRFSNLSGAVTNAGQIAAPHGVILAGASVLNTGSIVSRENMVILASGTSVYLGERDGNIFVRAQGAPARRTTQPQSVTGALGSTVLGAGDLYSAAIANTGVIKAKRIEAVASKNEAVAISGTLNARSATGLGGSIVVLGGSLTLQGAHLDASGATGGGSIRVGGDFHGQGTLPTATQTLVDAKSTLRADALTGGSGGSVVVWSNSRTDYFGNISAKGGLLGGDGGSAEVSSKAILNFQGSANLTATHGKTGNLLLDPFDLTIVSGASGSGLQDGAMTAGGLSISATDTSPNTLSTGALQGLAANANVIISASNSITFPLSGTLALATTAGNSFSFTTLTGNITSGTNYLIQTNGGNLVVQAGGNVTLGNLTTAGGNITLTASSGAGTVAVHNIGSAGNVSVSGNLLLGGTAGGATLSVSGTSGLNGGGIVTTGSQSYGGLVSLGADTALSGTCVSLTGGVSGGTHNLTVTGTGIYGGTSSGLGTLTNTGDAVFTGTVGASSLNVTGNTTLSGTVVATSGAQNYGGTTTLTVDNTLTGSTVNFGGALSGAKNLTLVGSGTYSAINNLLAVSNTGNATFGSTVNAGSVHVTGNTILNGASETTTTTQAYDGTVTQGADTHVTATTLTIGTTWNASGFSLQLTSGAAVALPGLYGAVKNFTSDGVGGTTLNGTFTTTGFQTFNNTVTLVTDTALNGTVVSLTGGIAGGTHNLTVTGTGIYAGTSSGIGTLTNSGNAAFSGTLSAGAAIVTGSTALNGAVITTTGSQNYMNTVTLGGDTILSGTPVLFGGGITGNSHNLTVTGTSSFGGPVTGVTALSDTGSVTFSGSVSAASVLVTGSAFIGGGSVAATGSQSYGGLVTLGADTALSGIVSLAGGIAGGTHNLTVTGTGLYGAVSGVNTLTNTGGAQFGGAVAVNNLIVTGTAGLFNGDITTSGSQSYGGLVTLGGNTALTALVVSLTSGVAGGGHDLTVTGTGIYGATSSGLGTLTNTGNATLSGAMGAGALIVTGSTALNGAVVATTGSQNYMSAVTLGGDTVLSGTPVLFGGAVTGNSHNLTVTGTGGFGGPVTGVTTLSDTGSVTFSGSVSVASVLVTGSAFIGGGSVATTGSQSYGGLVTLGADTALNGIVSLAGGLAGGTHNLTVTGTGLFGGAVSGVNTLTDNGGARFGNAVGVNNLIVTGTTGLFNGGLTTTGSQSYGGLVTLGGNTALIAPVVSLTGGVTGGGHDLTVTGTGTYGGTSSGIGTLTNNGNAALSGTMGAGAVIVTGSTALNGVSVTTTGSQNYMNAVTLGGDTVLSGTPVLFGAGITGNSHNLTVTGAGFYAGPVSGVTALGNTGNATFGQSVNVGSLLVTGSTSLNGGSVVTTGSQSYVGGVGLGTDTVLNGPLVVFGSNILGGSHNLAVSGTGLYGGPVSGVAALSNTGNATFNQSVSAGSLLVTGSTSLNGGSVVTTGSQSYVGAVGLGANTVLNGALVVFGSNIAGNSHSLAVSGTGLYGGAVSGVTALSNTGNATFDQPVTADSLLVTGSTALNGGSVVTTGTQSYLGGVGLGTDTVLTGSLVAFGSNVDGGFHNLVVNGLVSYGGPISGVAVLSNTGNVTFNYPVSAGTVLVMGSASLNGGSVVTTGSQSYVGGVGLGTDTLLNGSLVVFGSNIAGNSHSLAVSGTGIYNGPVSGVAALSNTGNATFSQSVSAGSVLVTGSSDLNGGLVVTTGSQNYQGTVGLSADTLLSGPLVVFGSNIAGNSHSLAISGTGLYGGPVAGVAALSNTGDATFSQAVNTDSLWVTGSTSLNGGSVVTTGSQSYVGGVGLGTDTLLSGPQVVFGSNIEGNSHSLAVSGTGSFGGPVTGVAALSNTGNATFNQSVSAGSVVVTGSADLNGGLVITTGSQSYVGGVGLGTDTSLSGPLVVFGSNIAGNSHSLAVSGTGLYGGPVAGVTALSNTGDAIFSQLVNADSLLVTGSTSLNGGAVVTTGSQSYVGGVGLGTDTLLNGPQVVFGSNIAGGSHNLAVTGTGTYGGPITGVAALSNTGNATFNQSFSAGSVIVTGSTDLNGGLVISTGTQSYVGGVGLGTDTVLNAPLVVFGSNLAGNSHSLAVSGTGLYNGPVSGVTALSNTGNATFSQSVNAGSVSVTGSADLNGGSVITTGSQSYAGGVGLGTDTLLSGPLVVFGANIAGNSHSLAVSGTGLYGGPVAGVTALSNTGNATFSQSVNTDSLLVTGSTSLNGGLVITTGSQSYVGGVGLGTDTLLSGPLVVFGSNIAGGSHNLAVNGTGLYGGPVAGVAALSNTGNATFNQSVSAGSVLVTGSSDLNGGLVVTTGSQSYVGGVGLGTDTLLSGPLVVFGSNIAGNSHSLAVNGTGLYGGSVSGITALSNTGNATFSQSVNADSLLVTGSTSLNGGLVITTGSQNYQGGVGLGTDTLLTGPLVVFGSNIAGNSHSLAVNGTGLYGGPVAGVTALSNTGNATFSQWVSAGSVIVTGSADLNGGLVVTTGSQNYQGAVGLSANTLLSGPLVVFGSNIAGNSHSLAVNGTGLYGGPVAGVTALSNTGNATFSQWVSAGSVLVTGSADLNGGLVVTTGLQDYRGAVGLSADTLLNGSQVSFESNIEGNFHSLAVNGAGFYGGPVAGVTALSNTGNATFRQSVNAGSVLVTGSADLNGGLVMTTGLQNYQGQVGLSADTLLSGPQVSFGSNIAGNSHSLAVNGAGLYGGPVAGVTVLSNTGNATFDRAVSAGSLLVTGPANLNGGSVVTTNAQTYGETVALGANTTLKGTTVSFVGNVAGNAHNLSVTATGFYDGPVGNVGVLNNSGNATFQSPVSAVSLHVTGATDINGGSITTTKEQAYDGAAHISRATTLSANGSTVTFGSTLSANDTLDVVGSGVYDGTVTGAFALRNSGNAIFHAVSGIRSILVTGITHFAGGSVQTSDSQRYEGAVNLGSDASLSAPKLQFDSSIKGNGHNLSVVGSSVYGGNIAGVSEFTQKGGTVKFGGSISVKDATVISTANIDIVHPVNAAGSILLASTAPHGTITLDAEVSAGTVSLRAPGSITIDTTVTATDGIRADAAEIKDLANIDAGSGDLVLNGTNGLYLNADSLSGRNVLLNTGVLATSADGSAATIVSANRGTLAITASEWFEMGFQQKFTSLGSLKITAQKAMIGDLAARTSLQISAPDIVLQDRQADGGIFGGRTDRGLSIVSSSIDFGSANVSLAQTGNGTVYLAALSGQITVQRTAGMTVFADASVDTEFQQPQAKAAGAQYPSLIQPIAGGVVDSDVVSVLAGALPAVQFPETGPGETINAATVAKLLSLGVSARDPNSDELRGVLNRRAVYEQIPQKLSAIDSDYQVVVNRITPVEVSRVLAKYDKIFGLNQENKPQIEALLGSVYAQYVEKTQATDASALGPYLNENQKADPAVHDAVKLVLDFRDLLKQLDRLGLNTKELSIAQNVVARSLSVEGLTPADFLTLVGVLPPMRSVLPAPLPTVDEPGQAPKGSVEIIPPQPSQPPVGPAPQNGAPNTPKPEVPGQKPAPSPGGGQDSLPPLPPSQ